MRRIIPIVLTALLLAACGTVQNVGNLLSSPATSVALYDAELGYASTQKLALRYYAYCFTNHTYAQILADPVAKPICQTRRTVWRKVQKADRYALQTITTANSVLTSSAVDAAVAAVKAFTGAVPAVPVN